MTDTEKGEARTDFIERSMVRAAFVAFGPTFLQQNKDLSDIGIEIDFERQVRNAVGAALVERNRLLRACQEDTRVTLSPFMAASAAFGLWLGAHDGCDLEENWYEDIMNEKEFSPFNGVAYSILYFARTLKAYADAIEPEQPVRGPTPAPSAVYPAGDDKGPNAAPPAVFVAPE